MRALGRKEQIISSFVILFGNEGKLKLGKRAKAVKKDDSRFCIFCRNELAVQTEELALKLADLNLFQTMETYDWAVKGLAGAS